MFDIGFSELLIIAVLTLIVMGPERLPETVRTITLWLGRLRQFLSAARTEIEDEVGVVHDPTRKLGELGRLVEVTVARKHWVVWG